MTDDLTAAYAFERGEIYPEPSNPFRSAAAQPETEEEGT